MDFLCLAFLNSALLSNGAVDPAFHAGIKALVGRAAESRAKYKPNFAELSVILISTGVGDDKEASVCRTVLLSWSCRFGISCSSAQTFNVWMDF